MDNNSSEKSNNGHDMLDVVETLTLTDAESDSAFRPRATTDGPRKP